MCSILVEISLFCSDFLCGAIIQIKHYSFCFKVSERILVNSLWNDHCIMSAPFDVMLRMFWSNDLVIFFVNYFY